MGCGARRPAASRVWARTASRFRSLWLADGALEAHNNKLQARYREIQEREVLCEEYRMKDAEIVMVAYGIAARIARSAVDRAREESIPAGLIRPITLWPFPSEQISRAAERFPIFLTVEMSAGQMVDDVKLAVAGKAPVLLLGRPGGGIPTVEEVLDRIRQLTLQSKQTVA